MSIIRHPSLQPFSRDHVVGLFHAHQLKWLAEGRARFDKETTVRNFQRAWIEELTVHFDDEETLLANLPIRQESIDRLFAEHKQLRLLAEDLLSAQEAPLADCVKIGTLLDDHIRWEEHDFFPEIENSLSELQIEELAKETRILDSARKRTL